MKNGYIRIWRFEVGFSDWTWPEYLRGGCDCSIISFGPFFLTYLRNECRAKSSDS